MDASSLKAEQFAGDIANQAKTLEDLNELLRTLAKSAMERMLDRRVADAGFADHGRSRCRGDSLATTATGSGVAHRLPLRSGGACPRRQWPRSPHTMYVAIGVNLQGEKGASGPVAQRDGRREVLAELSDGP